MELLSDDSTPNNFNPEDIIDLMEQQINQILEQNAAEDLHCPFIQEWNNEEKDRCTRIRRFSPPKNKNRLMKDTVRNGIDDMQRNNFYLFLSGIDETYNESRQYWSDIVVSNSNPRYDNIISIFGFPDYKLDVPKPYLENFLTILLNQNKDITYSPMIPSVASILSLYLKPDVAYLALQSMINQEDKYFTKTKQEFAIMLKTIEQIIAKNGRANIYQHTKTLKLNISEISLFVMPLLLSRKVDKRVSLTIFDYFIYDGRSVLMRYVIGIIFYLRTRLLATRTASDFMNVIFDYIITLHNPTELNELKEFTFSLSFSKGKKVIAIENKAKKTLKCSELTSVLISPLPKIDEFASFHQYSPLFNVSINGRYTYDGRTKPTISINSFTDSSSTTNNGQLLSNNQFFNLKQILPKTYKRYKAFPVYLMSVDGTSMVTFLEKAKSCKVSLIVIKTFSKCIGAVMECPMKKSCNYNRKAGPSTTIFDLTNNKAYRSSLKNSYYLHVTDDSISIGGGKTGCAIFIRDCFSDVISDPCETFDSPPLLDTNKEAIDDIELYRLSV